MWLDRRVIDADGHVMEPLWLWPEYIDAAYRDSCLRVARDARDGDKLLVDGSPSRLIRRLGGVPAGSTEEIQDWNSLPARGEFSPYRESCTPASYDGSARVAWLDASGIDTTYLFPSLGLIWPRETDPCGPYTLAHYDAYNRWIMDFVGGYRDRLVPVAEVALGPDLPDRLERLAESGFRDVMFPQGVGVGAEPTLGPATDAFFAAVASLGLVVHLHKVAVPHFLPTISPTTLRSPGLGAFFNHVNETLPGQLCLAALLDAGVLDRFPDVRFALHEFNGGWLPAWIERAEESRETLQANGVECFPRLPAAAYVYDRDTLFFSVSLGEDLTRLPAPLLDRLMLATDYPHPGTPAAPREAWLPVLDGLPTDSVTGLLGGNAARLMSGREVSSLAG